MNILYVVHNYYPAIGGVEWLIKNLSEKLCQKGHSVQVIATNATSCESYNSKDQVHPILTPGREVINGVKILRVPFVGGGILLIKVLRMLSALFYKFHLPFHGFMRALLQGPLSPSMLLEVLKSPCDLIVASPLPTLNVLYAFIGGKMKRKPIVVIPCFHVEDKWGFDRKLFYHILKGANRVITLTEYEKGFLMSKGVKEEKMDVLGVGIDPNLYQNKRDLRKEYGIGQSPVVLFAGQLAFNKGIEDLIKAMKIIWEEGPDPFLVIAGSPTIYFPHLSAMINGLPPNFKQKTILISGFPEEEKGSIFNMANVFVSVSKFESFGIVYLEAWLHRKPVIGCLQGASSTLIEDGKDGMLVRFNKPKELASAIKELLYDGNLQSRLGENGYYKVMQKYQWENIVKGYEASYLKALRNDAGSVLPE